MSLKAPGVASEEHLPNAASAKMATDLLNKA